MKPKIKAYVGYSERSNTRYYRDFEIVPYLPSVGDEIDGWEVQDITPVVLDCEQGSDRAYSYDYYEIDMVDSVGLELNPNGSPTHYHDTLYYAIQKDEEDEEMIEAARENFDAFANAETTEYVITTEDDLGDRYFKSVSAAEWLAFCEDCAQNLSGMGWTAEEREDWEDEYGVYGYTADKIAELMAD
jgi:hypothetical protein